MNKKGILFLLILISGTISKGYTAGEFLEIGMGAEALGTGEAYIGKSDNFSASYWNPGGLSFINNNLIGLHINSYFEGIYLNYLSAVIPVKTIGTFGISSTYLSPLGDDIFLTKMGTSGAIVETGNTYSFFDFNLVFSYARQMTEKIGIGANIKYIHSNIEEENASTMALDAGILMKKILFNDMDIGFVFVNIGPGLKYIENSSPLPAALKAGLCKILSSSELNKWTLLNDYIIPFNSPFIFSMGIEYTLKNTFFLRTGYQYSSLKKQASLGAGLNLSFADKCFMLNSAFLIPLSKLDNVFAFDFSFKF